MEEIYCNFYGFKEKPFGVTADPEFFFLSNSHREALAHLHYGVKHRKGIIIITGEIGTGKTTLCKYFLKELENSKQPIKTAFILNPYFSELQLLEMIMRDYGIIVKAKTRLGFIWEFNKFLIEQANLGNNVVLIIDESQNLKPSQLEQIRLLSNLETEKQKLLQIVLVGQPELNQRLELYNLRQIKQRVMIRYHIRPLNEEEVALYIQHRLKIVGSKKEVKFEKDTFKLIYNFSAGIPRLINLLCNHALLAGFTLETRVINSEIIYRCIRELQDYPTKKGL